MTKAQTPRDVMRRVGARVKALRLDAGYTQLQFSRRIPMDLSMLQSLEQGRRNATIRTLSDIAVTLDVDISELFRP